jgi:hypothetical protein
MHIFSMIPYMNIRNAFLTSIFVVLYFLASPADAIEKRVALVVGISNYQTVPKLKNTINDSDLIASTLEDLEFEVTRLTDSTLVDLRAAVSKFSFDAETADIALVYYAGHGVEFGGKNLLLPADISGKNRAAVAGQSVSLDEILLSVDKARQLRIVILDSCRDDPFLNPNEENLVLLNVETETQSTSLTGLAKPSPDQGTLVAFAAEAGNVALDGAGTNSPFALALANNLKTKDLEIGLMFRRVRDDVLRKTNNSQEPHTYGSLSGNPYFLSGNSREFNVLVDKGDRKNVWATLKPDQEKQLIALADGGDTRALKGLAYMRLNPDEARYAPEQAISLLLKAADKGDPEAQFELARLYEKGIGVEQDVDKAVSYYWKAADQKFPDAINDLGFLHFQSGLGILRDPKKAINLFQKAADLRHPEAMFNLAALIDDGIVPNKNPKDAASYLYESLRSGNGDVLKQLSENPKMFKQATRRELQKLLAEKSFYEGAFDADFGPQTKRSLRKAYGIEE